MKFLLTAVLACGLAGCAPEPKIDYKSAIAGYLAQCQRDGHDYTWCDVHMDQAFGMGGGSAEDITLGILGAETLQ